MKNFSFLLIILTLLNIGLCEENIKDNPPNENKEIENSSKKTLEISHKLVDYLNSLKNLTEITKDELNEIFLNIFDLIVDDPLKLKNETNLGIISNFTDEVFDRLADKEKNVIIVENILGKSNISIITEFITRFFKALKIEEILSKFLKASLKILGEMLLNIFKSTDL